MYLYILIVPVCLLGCATGKMDFLSPADPPVVWPKPPDQARVRYLGTLKSSEDIHPSKSFAQTMEELLYGPEPPARLNTPYAVAVDHSGRKVAVADTNGRCVHLFDLEKREYARKIECGGRPLQSPVAVSWDGNSLWVADAQQGKIAFFAAGGEQRWLGDEKLQRPAGLCWSSKKERCYVVDVAAHTVYGFDRNGHCQLAFGGPGTAEGKFNYPTQIAVAPDGNVVVADSMNFRVQQFSPQGEFLSSFGKKGDAPGDFALPKGVGVDSRGRIWVVDSHFENVQVFNPDGRLLLTIGKEGTGPGEFWLPAGICIDKKKRIWVADSYNRRVQVLQLIENEE
jgi:DNA-binding beta-propeller fold protein YncE